MPSRYTLEIGVGIGVLGKGINSKSHHDNDFTPFTVWNSIVGDLRNHQLDRNLRSSHAERFFWTSNKHNLKRSSRELLSSAKDASESPAAAFSATSARYEHALSLPCDFSGAKVKYLQSHVSVSMETDNHSPECMLQLSSVASLHPHVSHVTAYSSELNLEQGGTSSRSADDVFANTTAPATDQNAWVQTGSDLTTPYTDMGLDGSTYVLGMIDTGVDDFSCFFVDDSGTPTTRTAAADYATPITEPNRRKVIQYVAWADGLPSYNYDHGQLLFRIELYF